VEGIGVEGAAAVGAFEVGEEGHGRALESGRRARSGAHGVTGARIFDAAPAEALLKITSSDMKTYV
jgi:hypothetical protein